MMPMGGGVQDIIDDYAIREALDDEIQRNNLNTPEALGNWAWRRHVSRLPPLDRFVRRQRHILEPRGANNEPRARARRCLGLLRLLSCRRYSPPDAL